MQKKIEIISKSSASSVVDLPSVFRTPVRSDLISFVHKNVALNKRQPYAVNPDAGKNYSAEGWGTGRAVARVAHIRGSGTRRAGQGAFANFCRGGHMAHPTNVRRRWQRKTPLNMRRLVTAMGISASAVAPIVESRGHRISGLKSIPLVVDNEMLQDVKKTKDAVKFLVELGLTEEMDKTKEVFIKSGKGKMRNRRYKVKKGPLIVYDKEICTKAFRNVQGVDMCRVDDLNVLELCPGGQPGRLVIWMKDAFVKLHDLFGDLENEANLKAGFLLTEGIASGDDIERIFHSCEVQAFIDEPCLIDKPKLVKNVKEIEKLNPYLSLIN